MGTLAARMGDRGLLERVTGPGRAIHHQGTDAGEQARTAGAGVMDGVFEHTIGRLDEHDLRLLHDLLLRATAAEE